MKRYVRIVLWIALAGVLVLGTTYAAKKPPAIPIAVTIHDIYPLETDPPTVAPCMLRSDMGGDYVNGAESVTATLDGEYGELYFNVPSTSSRRVLLEFVEAAKEVCANACKSPALPPGLGVVNDITFQTYSRSAWSCESRWVIDCTHDFRYMPPGTTGYTNLRIYFTAPGSNTLYLIDYSRVCEDMKAIGYVFFAAGADRNGDGYADEWDLYPVPEGNPVFVGDRAHVWFQIPGRRANCSFGRYVLPFRIHLSKI